VLDDQGDWLNLFYSYILERLLPILQESFSFWLYRRLKVRIVGMSLGQREAIHGFAEAHDEIFRGNIGFWVGNHDLTWKICEHVCEQHDKGSEKCASLNQNKFTFMTASAISFLTLALRQALGNQVI
jgi:hypothetical protein